MPFRTPSRTTQLADLPPGDDGPSPDELIDFGGETTDAFVARTGLRAPAPLGASDPVPVFRTDLQIGKGASPGLFEVGDPATGRHFTLYEFELSIARMLDGRRHASAVIENGVRLGIPVDLDGLNKFVRQLWRYGFLAEPGAAPPAEEGEERGWGERQKWDEATRTLFQTGLRLVRQGRPQDAQSYFQAVLDADPGNAEAAELLAAIERGETLVAGPIGQRGARSAPSAPRRRKRAAVALVVAGIAVAGAGGAAAWFAWKRPPVAPPAPPPPVAAPAPAPPPPPPRPAWRTAAVQRREHPALAAVASPAAGVVIWKGKDGASVRQGERIGTLRTLSGAGAAPIDPAAAARIRELEALAAQDPVYREFLEKERRAAQRKRGAKAVREVKLVAPATGLLSLVAAGRARVEAGAALASVVDPTTWIVDAFVDGDPPAADAACELRGDAVEERLPCGLDAVEPAAGGSQLRLSVPAADAPWLGRSRSLRVRVAPPGTPAEAAAGGEEGTP